MALRLPIYLDNNATTPVDPRVLEAMMPYLTEHFGNPASRSHSFGWKAKDAVDEARRQVAALICATPKEIIFTSGATESDNLGIKGVAEMYRSKGNHIVTCRTEHKAVLDTCEYLSKQGYEITSLTPDKYGRLSPEQVDEAITAKTILITIMAANNETGVLHPINEIGLVAKRRGVLFHTDATQAVGKIPLDVQAMNVDLLSLSGHKMYAPKGIGALFVRRRDPRVRLAAQIHGGGHERNIRSGTLNAPGVVALGKASQLAAEQMDQEAARLGELRDRLEEGILRRVDYVKRNGHPTERVSNTTNLSFAFVEGESMMMKMKDIAVSSGSACTSASLDVSFVLKAMGVPDDLGNSSIRFSLGRFTTPGDIDYAVEHVVSAVEQLRELSPLFEQAREKGDISGVEWTRVK